MNQRDLVVSLVKSTGDVGVILTLRGAGVIEDVNWKRMFEITFPEYFAVYQSNDIVKNNIDRAAARIQKYWEYMSLWMTYIHRRLLKYLARESKQYKGLVELINTESGSVRIDEVLFKGKRITRAELARLMESKSGLLIDFNINENVIKNMKIVKYFTGGYRSIMAPDAGGRVDRYTIVPRQLSELFCNNGPPPLFERSPYPVIVTGKDNKAIPKDERKIFLGKPCEVCDQESFNKCSQCEKVLCSKDCFSHYTHTC